MRPEEKYAADLFQDYLKNKGHQVTYKPGNDPPDAHFYVDDMSWAVEVTRLFQYVDDNGKEESRATIESRLRHLITKIDRKTKLTRKNGYDILLMKKLSKEQEGVVLNNIINFISSSQSRSSNLEQIQKGIFIRKINDPEKKIRGDVGINGIAKIPGTNKIIADIQATIDYSINRILKQKSPRLSNLTNYSHRNLLILGKANMFTSPANVGKAINNKINDIKGIDEIYLICNKQVSLVYSI